MGVFENLFRLQIEKTEAHGAVTHDAFQMPAASAAAVFFARIERHYYVSAFPDAFVPGIDAEADAVAEGPDADKPVQLAARGSEARGHHIGIVIDVNGSIQTVFAQGV